MSSTDRDTHKGRPLQGEKSQDGQSPSYGSPNASAPGGPSKDDLTPLKLPPRPGPDPVTPSSRETNPQDGLNDEDLNPRIMPDERLMKMCQDGDEISFEELFRRYEGPTLSFIYRMIGDRGRTEALGQEAFLRIFRDARSYQYPRNFSTWFYTIVRNLCKNELRWRSRHPTVSIEENLDNSDSSNSKSIHVGDNLRANSKTPLEHIERAELSKELEKAMACLTDLEKEILILKQFQGLKYKEIAEVVNVSVGVVRSRIHSALEKLRKSIKNYL